VHCSRQKSESETHPGRAVHDIKRTLDATDRARIMHVLVSRVMSTSNLAEEAVIDAGALHADNRLPPTAQDNQGKEMQQTLSPTPSTASPT